MKDLILKIEQWAEDRNLIEGSTVEAQSIKLFEEFGELCSGMAKNNLELIKDSIGDCFVVLTIVARQKGFTLAELTDGELCVEECEYNIYNFVTALRRAITSITWINFAFDGAFDMLQRTAEEYGFTLEECVQSAYDEIKDRKGKMINGVFVKGADLK